MLNFLKRLFGMRTFVSSKDIIHLYLKKGSNASVFTFVRVNYKDLDKFKHRNIFLIEFICKKGKSKFTPVITNDSKKTLKKLLEGYGFPNEVSNRNDAGTIKDEIGKRITIWHCVDIEAYLGTRLNFAQINKTNVIKALGKRYLNKEVLLNNKTIYQCFKILHIPTGQYTLTYRSNPDEFLLGKEIDRIKDFGTKTHGIRNIPLFLFAQEELRDSDFKLIKIDDINGLKEAKRFLGDYAYYNNPERLLTAGLLDYRDWNHPNLFKQQLANEYINRNQIEVLKANNEHVER